MAMIDFGFLNPSLVEICRLARRTAPPSAVCRLTVAFLLGSKSCDRRFGGHRIASLHGKIPPPIGKTAAPYQGPVLFLELNDPLLAFDVVSWLIEPEPPSYDIVSWRVAPE
jgi:hypothetical protein